LPPVDWWCEIDPEAGGLHLALSVEPGDRLFELFGGGDVKIVMLFPAPDTQGVPAHFDIPKYQAQGAACSACDRTKGRRPRAEPVIPQRSITAFFSWI
jgi:hypothetical protein